MPVVEISVVEWQSTGSVTEKKLQSQHQIQDKRASCVQGGKRILKDVK